MPVPATLSEINSLDPARDHQRIVFLTTRLDFPFDSVRALEFALMETSLRARGRVARLFFRRQQACLRTELPHPTYPEGHVIESVGPPPAAPPPGGGADAE